METRREIAVATTNSVSGFIDRDGRVVDKPAEFTSAGFVKTMPLRSTLTPAVVVGAWPAWLLSLFALAAVALAVRRRPVRKNDDRPGAASPVADPSPTKEPIR
jgi:apolipoprotein N-acyltransferase